MTGRLPRMTVHGITLTAALVAISVSAREVRVGSDDDWRAALNALEPGDVAVLQPGRYKGITRVTVKGTAEAPITIRGAAGHARR